MEMRGFLDSFGKSDSMYVGELKISCQLYGIRKLILEVYARVKRCISVEG